jgi:hypothetical protein
MNARRATQLVPPAETPALSPYAIFLQEIIAKTGKRASAIAKELHLPESTLTRHLPKPDGTAKPRTPRTMHAETIAKLEQFSGIVAPSALTRGGGNAEMLDRREIARVASDAIKLNTGANDDIDLAGGLRALVGNRLHAEAWELRSASLECVGYLPGDLLIVDRNAVARDGDVVCVNYCPWGRAGHAETLMRIYRDAGGMRFVIGATFDPALQDPLPIDNDRAVVMGVVTHSVRIARRRR